MQDIPSILHMANLVKSEQQGMVNKWCIITCSESETGIKRQIKNTFVFSATFGKYFGSNFEKLLDLMKFCKFYGSNF